MTIVTSIASVMAKHIVASLTIALLVVAYVSTELPDDYAVFKIQQKGACSTVYCPWYCDRYIDANGCVYCGKCTKPHPYACPQITCPNVPLLECTARQGRDGCTVCKCRPHQLRAQRPMSAPLIAAVPAPPAQVDAVVSTPIKTTTSSRCSGPTPLCSRRCHIAKDERGCERCACPLPKIASVATAGVLTGGSPLLHVANYAPSPLKRKPVSCPEAADAPCPRPNVCWRERGADGCYGCRCRDDVAVCREVKCDFSRCQHVIDQVTGCATGCQCGTTQRNDV